MKKIILLFLLMPFQSVLAQNVLIPDIAVTATGQHVVINIPQLRLFVFQDGKLVHNYPIAVGKNRTKTPPGEYTIRYKAYKPTWSIPVSIQRERAQQGKPHITSIPPGPNNPLGPVFVRFGDPKLGLGIHGTNAPSSVPGVRSHGCVRMKNQDVLQFAQLIEKDSTVSVIYQTFSLNEDEAGQLWLSTYPDPYYQKGKSSQNLLLAINQWLKKKNIPVDEIQLMGLIKKSEKSRKNKKNKPICLHCSSEKPTLTGNLASLSWTEGLADVRNVLIDPETLLPELIEYDIKVGTQVIDLSENSEKNNSKELPWYLNPSVKSTQKAQ